MITEEDRFRDYLKKKGLKFTPERKLILKEVFSFHKHFNVEELFPTLGLPIRRIFIIPLPLPLSCLPYQSPKQSRCLLPSR